MTVSKQPVAGDNEVEKQSFEDASEQTSPVPVTEANKEDTTENDAEAHNNDTAEEKPNLPECDPGMDVSTKELYRRERYEPWQEWEGEIPDDDAEKYKRYALVVRRERDPDGGGVLLHSVTIQSPYIRALLTKVFEGHRGVYPNLKRLVFRPPFHDFYYRWDKFHQVIAETTDETTLQHVNLLKKVIEPEITPHLEAQEDLIKHELITYDYLWALFPPDTEVYAQTDSGERLYIARRCGYRKNVRSTTFVIDGEYIEYDGTILGYGCDRLEIEQYGGHLPIGELEVVPTSFMPNIVDIRRRLSDRGKAFEKQMGIHYKGYSGLYLPWTANSFIKPRRRHVDEGRIVIDAKLFHEQDPDRKPHLRPLGAEIKDKERSDDDYDYYTKTYEAEDEYMLKMETVKPGRTTLDEDEYCYCSAFVKGYCLTSKQWGN